MSTQAIDNGGGSAVPTGSLSRVSSAEEKLALLFAITQKNRDQLYDQGRTIAEQSEQLNILAVKAATFQDEKDLLCDENKKHEQQISGLEKKAQELKTEQGNLKIACVVLGVAVIAVGGIAASGPAAGAIEAKEVIEAAACEGPALAETAEAIVPEVVSFAFSPIKV
ncbi:MAG: hypothetical protein K1000chlam4_00211 [Chlamydiae bacterium]|nr:hypothetical protein [Chlamydiota bacterium]